MFIPPKSYATMHDVISFSAAIPQSEEERLHNHIFRNYNTAIRPVRKATDPVQVSLTFSLMQIHMLVSIILSFTVPLSCVLA
jgi:hypothetical protein